jgi:transposase
MHDALMLKKNEIVDISKVLLPLSVGQIKSLKKEELAVLLLGEQQLRMQFQTFYNEVLAANVELKEKKLLLEEQFVLFKNQFFARSSEKSLPPEEPNEHKKRKKKRKKKCQRPSERYPNVPLIKRDLELETPPNCTLCEAPMADSGMVESSEFLTVIPKNFAVIEQNRHKYRCSKCHGDIKTTPLPPRICPGSAYSDEMIMDVALSKYCDLIPIDRYVNMAARAGVMGLPPQSLIQLTHHLADFVKAIYYKIRDDILLSRVLHADETPHRMLEGGGDKENWYLWGFSNKQSSYFEIHDTRSGSVASELLKQSVCEKLISDVFSGYAKAVRVTNEHRSLHNKCPIQNCYCNAHARRKFKAVATINPAESEIFISLYSKIYRLEKIAQKRPFHRILRVRKLMNPLFEEMKTFAIQSMNSVSSKSQLAIAMNYFIENFKELTHFLVDPEVAIDNNQEERQLRSPVVGRKTWYGTHSERGAETNAVLFTLVQSCKLSGVNPREYFRSIIEDFHAKKEPPIPAQFKNRNLLN